jgi:transposase
MRYIGLDVHKDSIAVAVAEAGTGDVRYLGPLAPTSEALRKLVTKCGPSDRLRFAYEAGPCGYGVYRTLTQLGCNCRVVAPSLIPRRPGDRVKTDRRDAVTLARLLRAGELTPVWVPDPEQEALRDLTRAREDAKLAQTRARQRLNAFLLRHGQHFPGRSRWSQAHRRWLASLRLPQPVQQVVLEEYLQAVEEATTRIARLTQQIEHAVEDWSLGRQVRALQALRGVSLIVAATVLAEIGRLNRFAHPKQLMAYVGLVPCEHSSGSRVRRGAITKTGNGHVRRVLTEGAWAYRYPPRCTRELLLRQHDQSAAVKGIAWRAQLRLWRRYRRLLARGKVKQQAVTAVARELCAFMWEIDRASDARAA